MGAFGPQKRLRGEMGPETINIPLATGYFARGCAKGRFCAPSRTFCEKALKWRDSTIFMKMGGNSAKIALFRERGARGVPNLSVTHGQTFGDSDTVRVGNTENARGGGLDPWGAARPVLRNSIPAGAARQGESGDGSQHIPWRGVPPPHSNVCLLIQTWRARSGKSPLNQ